MSALADLAPLAAEQWGLVTSAQARALGVTTQALARLERADEVERLAHGVYRLGGTPEHELDHARVAWLRLDPARTLFERQQDTPPDAISHRTAARVHGLGDLDADRVQITVPRRRQTRDPDVRLLRGHLSSDDWQLVDGLPVTTAARTVADLAADATDGGHLAHVVRDALDRELAEAGALADALAPHARRYGAPARDGEGALTRLLAEAGGPRPEADLFRSVARLLQTITTQVAPSALRADLMHHISTPLPPAVLTQVAEQQRRTLNALSASIVHDAQRAALESMRTTSAFERLGAAALASGSRAHTGRSPSFAPPPPTAHGPSTRAEIATLLDSPELAAAAADHPVVARLVSALRRRQDEETR